MKLLVVIITVYYNLFVIDCNTLELVHVFFRHGSRTPEEVDTYPNDPYKIEHFTPIGWGQLTNTGKQQAYQLGKMLRNRYDQFLGNIYTPDVIRAYSTDFDRTKVTLLLVLAGLFPPAPIQRWDSDLQWLPIPYDFKPHHEDYIIRRPNSYCPAYMTELENMINSEMGEKIVKDNKKIFQYVARHAGKPINKLMDMFRIYQTLNAEDNMNLTLPKWTENVYPEKIRNIAVKQCELENYNNKLKRLNGGRILSKVIENIKNKIMGMMVLQERKMYLYSGHENNVINILAALNLYEIHFPKYTATVIIEVHRDQLNQRFIKVFYARDVNSTPEEYSIPGCSNSCSFNNFLSAVEQNVPTNYTLECNSVTDLD